MLCRTLSLNAVVDVVVVAAGLRGSALNVDSTLNAQTRRRRPVAGCGCSVWWIMTVHTIHDVQTIFIHENLDEFFFFYFIFSFRLCDSFNSNNKLYYNILIPSTLAICLCAIPNTPIECGMQVLFISFISFGVLESIRTWIVLRCVVCRDFFSYPFTRVRWPFTLPHRSIDWSRMNGIQQKQ